MLNYIFVIIYNLLVFLDSEMKDKIFWAQRYQIFPKLVGGNVAKNTTN